MNQYNVQYQRDGGEINFLPSVDIGYDWKGFSGLVINADGNSAQPLLENQTITAYTLDDENVYVVEGGPNRLFELSYPVHNETGSRIRVTTTDEFDNEVLNSVYVYDQLLNGTYHVYGSDNRITLLTKDIDTVTTPIEIPIVLEPGDYILPINGTTTADLNYILFDYWTQDGDDAPVHTTKKLNIYSDTNKFNCEASDKLFYYDITVPSTTIRTENPALGITEPKLRFVFGQEPEENVVIEDIFKYKQNPLFGTSFNDIRDKVFQLDDSQDYNYTWRVVPTDEIENPLEPSDFFRTSHVFKKFIISKWDADGSSFRFSTEDKVITIEGVYTPHPLIFKLGVC